MDDLSPDGTGEAVLQEYKDANVIYGDGKLYWAGGVRLILKTIGEEIKNFDAILLINDDIVLKPSSLDSLIGYGFSENAIVGGTVLTKNGDLESSGSLLGKICKPKPRLLIANGHLQKCELIPGHIMLIPMDIYEDLNGFDVKLPYRFLDLEFTHRASRSGKTVLLAPDVVAITDEVHDYYQETSSMRGSLSNLVKRILLDPKGPYWKESVYYLRKISPILWWLWLPFFYRAFFVAVFKSYYEKLPFVRKPATPVTLEK
jgi:GT2 family glycosyltransferase